MADKRIIDYDEAASAGADYYLVTDSTSDGVKKIKPSSIVPAYTGDVTSAAGGTINTIANNAVTNAKAAQMATGTIKSNLTGALASASDNTINAVMDAAFGSTQGAIAYRGASGWSSLAPGVSGQFMQTSGPSANPTWQTISGGGNMLSSTYDPTGKLTDIFNYTPSGTGAVSRSIVSKLGEFISVKDFGASGSNQTTTGTTTAASTTLTLAAALDFEDKHGIRINHAGAAFATDPPTALTVTPTGTTGATTYTYQIASLDSDGGVGAAITSVATATGNATLSATNYNALSWTAPASGPAPTAYAVYGRIAGSLALIGIASTTSFNDVGAAAIAAPDWLPSTPQASALADWLLTTIASGAGTTALTLAAAATTAITGQTVLHEDSGAINKAIIRANLVGGGNVFFPAGTYRVCADPINLLMNVSLFGAQGLASQIVCDNQDGIILDYTTGLGNAVIDGLYINGSNMSVARTGVKSPGSTSSAYQLYGVTIQNTIICNFDTGIHFRTVQAFEIFNTWIQYVNQGIDLTGRNYNGRITDCVIVYAGGAPGFTGLYRQGINLVGYTYATGGKVIPEGITISGGQNIGFDIPINAQECHWLSVTRTSLAGNVFGFLFTNINNNMVFENNYVELDGPLANIGIYGTGFTSPTVGNYLIRDNTVIAAADAPSVNVGIQINDGSSANTLKNVKITGNYISGVAGTDILIKQPGQTEISDNNCAGVGTTSISVDARVSGIITVKDNNCSKTIVCNADDQAYGYVKVIGNVTNGTTLDPDGRVVTIAASGNAILNGNHASLVTVRENTSTGGVAAFLLSLFGTAVLVTQTGTGWSVGTTPASGAFSVGWDAAGSVYRIYNGAGASRDFSIIAPTVV